MKHFGITDPRIEDYIESLTPQSEGVLADMEAHAERENVPIIGPVEGQFLYTLALATQAKDILDIGTAIGYSAMWLGLAARENDGRVVTLEKDEGRAGWAEAYFRQARMCGVCAVRRGDALVLMNGMEENFDLIFLDILTQFDQRRHLPPTCSTSACAACAPAASSSPTTPSARERCSTPTTPSPPHRASPPSTRPSPPPQAYHHHRPPARRHFHQRKQAATE